MNYVFLFISVNRFKLLFLGMLDFPLLEYHISQVHLLIVVAATKLTIAMEALVVQEMVMGSEKATQIRINLKKKRLRRMLMLSHAVGLQLITKEAT